MRDTFKSARHNNDGLCASTLFALCLHLRRRDVVSASFTCVCHNSVSWSLMPLIGCLSENASATVL